MPVRRRTVGFGWLRGCYSEFVGALLSKKAKINIMLEMQSRIADELRAQFAQSEFLVSRWECT